MEPTKCSGAKCQTETGWRVFSPVLAMLPSLVLAIFPPRLSGLEAGHCVWRYRSEVPTVPQCAPHSRPSSRPAYSPLQLRRPVFKASGQIGRLKEACARSTNAALTETGPTCTSPTPEPCRDCTTHRVPKPTHIAAPAWKWPHVSAPASWRMMFGRSLLAP